MGYLRGTQRQAIKGTISLHISDNDDVNQVNGNSKENVQLELRHAPSFSEYSLNTDFGSLDASAYAARRRMFEVNGDPLAHWKKDNFVPKRDGTRRVVYEPKIGRKFFKKTLRVEDYAITRVLTTSLEQPYFSKYNRFFPTRGHFCCKGCGNALYSSEAKFDVDDGWPAFGACILGSIGVTPVEERIAQIEKKEQACIKIQSFVRSHQCRRRVENMLDEMIAELLRRKHENRRKREETQDDWISEGHSSSDFSWSSSSDEIDSSRRSWTSCTDESDNTERSKGSDGGYVLSRALGYDYAEIHCHRCKSHLGDVFAQRNVGNNGEEYLERHRVNGRALKYMDEDLPTTINAEASLLFADASQRRRLGLPETTENGLPLHWLNKSSDPLSVSNHETISKNDIRRKQIDSLSVSCHTSRFQKDEKGNTSPTKKAKLVAFTKRSEYNNWRRPMRRGSTKNSVSVADRTMILKYEVMKACNE